MPRLDNVDLENIDEAVTMYEVREIEKNSSNPGYINEKCDNIYRGLEESGDEPDDKRSFMKGCAATIEDIF